MVHDLGAIFNFISNMSFAMNFVAIYKKIQKKFSVGSLLSSYQGYEKQMFRFSDQLNMHTKVHKIQSSRFVRSS